jgi:hypothetical protein
MILMKRKILEFKNETLDCAVWRTRFGSGCGPVIRHWAVNVYRVERQDDFQPGQETCGRS